MKSRVAILAVTVALVGVSRAQAASITINEVAGTTYYTNGFTDFSVTSDQMNGMLVTAYWTLGGVAQGPQTSAWNDGVLFSGTGFNLAVSGNTYSNNAWELDFSVTGTGRLQQLVFDGVPGNTVFDRTFGGSGLGNRGTAGSDSVTTLAASMVLHRRHWRQLLVRNPGQHHGNLLQQGRPE